MQDQQWSEAGQAAPSAAAASEKRKRVPDRFGVSKWLLGLWGVLAAAALIMVVLRAGIGDAYAMGQFSGRLVMNFLICLLVGWLGYRFSGRRRLGANIGFVVALVLMGYLVFLAVGQSRRTAQAVSVARAGVGEIREANLRGDQQGAIDATSRVVDSLEELAKSSGGAQGKMHALHAEWLRRVRDSVAEQNRAVAAFLEAGGVIPETMKTLELIDKRMALIEDARTAQRAVLACFTEVDQFETRLIEKGVSAAEAKREVARFRQGENLERVIGLRKLDQDLSAQLIIITQILRKHIATIVWREESEGGFLFGAEVPPEDVAAYNAAVERAQEIEARQERMKAEFLGQPLPPASGS